MYVCVCVRAHAWCVCVERGGADINALCNYGYSLWREKKNVEAAERILRRVLAADPSQRVPNITIASPAERVTREQLVAAGLEVDDLDTFIRRNMTEIFSRPAVKQALHAVLSQYSSNSSAGAGRAQAAGGGKGGEEVLPHEFDYLRELVDKGVPPAQVCKEE